MVYGPLYNLGFDYSSFDSLLIEGQVVQSWVKMV